VARGLSGRLDARTGLDLGRRTTGSVGVRSLVSTSVSLKDSASSSASPCFSALKLTASTFAHTRLSHAPQVSSAMNDDVNRRRCPAWKSTSSLPCPPSLLKSVQSGYASRGRVRFKPRDEARQLIYSIDTSLKLVSFRHACVTQDPHGESHSQILRRRPLRVQSPVERFPPEFRSSQSGFFF
jgi:hypothetical protein